MRNLAGNTSCDEHIRAELTTAGIEVINSGRESGEVPYTLKGELKGEHGTTNFIRAWIYWVVDCLVPLAVAEELYADSIGKVTVRIAGHIGCPPPGEWAKVHSKLGKVITTYHIDTQEGLNLFVETLRKHGLA